MRTKVLLATGRAQSGKSTSCHFLKEMYLNKGVTAEVYSFADPLKEFCHNVLGLSETSVWGTNEEKNEPTHIQWFQLPLCKKTINQLKGESSLDDYLTGRQVMQIFGTEICRHMYNDCWAYSILKRVHEDDIEIALIDDARFPNELEIFDLSKERTEFQDRLCTKPYILQLKRNPLNLDHKSEKALDDYSYESFDRTTILNDGDMDINVRNIDLKIVAKLVRLQQLQENKEESIVN